MVDKNSPVCTNYNVSHSLQKDSQISQLSQFHHEVKKSTTSGDIILFLCNFTHLLSLLLVIWAVLAHFSALPEKVKSFGFSL